LNGLEPLRGIRVGKDHVEIGAMTIHEAVATSDAVRHAIPALAELAGGIGDPQVRHRGTIGGSLANNDPGACYPSSVLGLGATLVTNRREIAADDFFLGLFETALRQGEIITAVRFPIPDRAAYVKFANAASRFSIVGVFVARRGASVRVAVTGAGATVFRARELETALERDFAPRALEGIAISPKDLISDVHGSAAYRAQLIPILAQRAVERCG
jgi:carbon-monoxide dehydrogenase medium subunit